MTLTIDIPEDLVPRLAAMPEKDRQNYTLAALRLVSQRTPTKEPALTPEQLAMLGESLAQSDVGDVIDGDVFMAELFQSVGLPAPEPFNEQPGKKTA